MSKYLDQLNSKNTLTDADQFVIIDSQDNNNNKRVTKAVMATVFGGGGGGSSELITESLVYNGYDIELNLSDWKDIQSMNLQAGKYLILAMAGCKRTVTTAQVWQLRIQNATSNTTLSAANDNTPSNTTQFSQLNCWAIVELTAENTTIKTQARATTTSASYITKDTQTPVGNATQLIAIKLDGISGGSSYSLPIANETTLGGVKTDMNKKGIAVSGTGVIGLVDDVFGDIEIVYDNNERLSFKLNGECVNEVNLALSDNEYKNSDTTRHGLMPKLSGADNQTINGNGSWQQCMINLPSLSDKDIDDTTYAVETGYRYCDNTCTNTPVAGKDYLLVTFFVQDFGYQYAYDLDMNNRKIYIRYYDDTTNSYSPWTEIGSGGSLPSDNWLLGNVDLYNGNSLYNIINGSGIDFGSALVNNNINGEDISDNLNGQYISNSKINGALITLEDIVNSSINGCNLNIVNVDNVNIVGEEHLIGRHQDGVKVKNIKIAGSGVKNAWHSNAEYLSHGDNENVLVNPIFQNTKFTGKSRYIVQDGNSSIESFFINVGGLLDPTIILIDHSIQFVSLDLHLTYILSYLNKSTMYQKSFISAKGLLIIDMYTSKTHFRFSGTSRPNGIDIVEAIPFIIEMNGIVWNNNKGCLQLQANICPVDYYNKTSEDPTGFILDVFLTAEMHTIKNDVLYERS